MNHLCPVCSSSLPHRHSDRCPKCGAILRLGNVVLRPDAIVRLAEQVRASGYPWDAFEFVLRAFPKIRARLCGRDQIRTHIDAKSVCDGLLDQARHRFGPSASDQLASFGLHCSRDFGNVIYALVSAGFLKADLSDSPQDFDALFDVRTLLG